MVDEGFSATLATFAAGLAASFGSGLLAGFVRAFVASLASGLAAGLVPERAERADVWRFVAFAVLPIGTAFLLGRPAAGRRTLARFFPGLTSG